MLLSLVLVEQQGEEFESAMLTTLQNNVPNKVTLSRYTVYIISPSPLFEETQAIQQRKKINILIIGLT